MGLNKLKIYNTRSMCMIIALLIMIILSGCGEKEYTSYFTIDSISPVSDDVENMIEIDYSITNIDGGDDKLFCITINGKTEKYSIAPGASKNGKVIIDIGRTEQYEQRYAVKYSVLKNNKEIWSKEEELTYDCSAVFVHDALVEYNGEEAEISLNDYQFNVFDLTTIFDSFDPDTMHDVEVENSTHDLVGMFKSSSPEGGFYTPSEGKYLILGTRGYEETNDKYHYSDSLVIHIKNAIPAASVDWEKQMEFVEDSHYSTSSLYGTTITTFEMDVRVTNPSDETVYGSVTKFYVNDKAVADKYLAASDHRSIKPGETDKVYNYSGASIWETTGETKIYKFGLKVRLEDKDGRVLYEGIQWLNLK